MNFVLVSLLTAYLLIKLCSAEMMPTQDAKNQQSSCPPGYYLEQKSGCKICETGRYTELENKLKACRPCTICTDILNGIELEPCFSHKNSQCACRKGFYNKDINYEVLTCMTCFSNNPRSPDKCKECKRKECQDAPVCQKNCPETISTTASTPVPTSITSNNRTSNPVAKPSSQSQTNAQVLIPPAAGMMVLLVVILAIFRPSCCRPWKTHKDAGIPADDPELNEQHSHQLNNPTPLKVSICNEHPNVTLLQCLATPHHPATPDHPTHFSPLLPEYKATRPEEHSERSDRLDRSERWPAIVLYAIIKEVPLRRWKEFLRLLKVADQQLDRVDVEVSLGLGEKQYQMLRLWNQRPSASLDEVYSALHYMDLSGCAQLLQENLDKLQWTTEQTQDLAGCRNYAESSFIGTRQAT